jgi:hypothetical protein
VKAIPTIIALLVLAGCNNGGGASPDGSTDTGTTDADADSDADSDTDTDSLPYITDAGPWDWEPLPEMDGCGPRCRRITSEPDVQDYKWDVWNEKIVYTKLNVVVVDWMASTFLTLPNFREEYPIEQGKAAGAYATIAGDYLIYTNLGVGTTPLTQDWVLVDLNEKWQLALDTLHPNSAAETKFPDELDLNYPLAASLWGCEPYEDPNLCHNDVSLHGPATSLGDLGPWCNTIWGDYLVFLQGAPFGDVRGYKYSTQEFFDITNDDEIQFVPRLQGSLVVYQDLRLGDSTLEGDWNHSSVWLNNISTEQTVQITDGSSIAANPDVFGDTVIWEDFRHCPDPQNKNQFYCVEVFGKNLLTDVEFQITDLPTYAKQPPPRIWGDKVFVHMYPPSGGSALFVFDLPPEAD